MPFALRFEKSIYPLFRVLEHTEENGNARKIFFIAVFIRVDPRFSASYPKSVR